MKNLAFSLICVLFININGIKARFEAGYSYKYSYNTNSDSRNYVSSFNNSKYSTFTNDVKHLFDYTHKIRLDVFKNEDTKVFIKLNIENGQYNRHPIVFEYDTNNFKIIRFSYSSQETIEALNFKKGILDLLNLNLYAIEEISTIGTCLVEFTKSTELNIVKFKKVKRNCNRNDFLFSNEYRQFDRIHDVIVKRSNELDYEIDDYMIRNVNAIDNIDILFEFNKNSSRNIITKQTLKFENKFELKEQMPVINLDLTNQNLILSKPNEDKNKPKIKVEDLIINSMKSFKKSKSGTSETCQNFINFVKLLRDENLNEKKLRKLELSKFLQHERIASFIVDGFVAAQTKEALNVLLKELDIEKITEKLDKKKSRSIEKFFISSSFCTHKTLPELYKALKKLLTLQTFYNENLKDAAGLAIGSVVQTGLLKTNDTIIADEYYNLVKIEYQKCKINDCKLFFLNSLSNALLPQSISEMFEPEIELCKTKSTSLCGISLKALRKFSSTFNLSKKLTDNLLEISQSNSTDKFEALNLLLHNDETRNNKQVILNILLTIYNTMDFEFTLYAYKMITSLMKSCQIFRQNVEPMINEFNHKNLKLVGYSEVVRSTLFGAPNGKISFDMKQLADYSDGSIKSIEVSVNYEDKLVNKLVNMISFDTYSHNMNSVTNPSVGKDPKAGLALIVNNKKIKETEFFNGVTSLMNAIWSAPTKLTSLFEINYLISDQNEYILLQNGFIMNLNTIGALSIDVSALADISLWKQTAKTLLQTSVALDIESSLKIIHMNEQSVLNYDFNTNVKTEFYLDANLKTDPIQLCMKLLLNKIKLTQKAKNILKKSSDSQKSSLTIQPSTYMLSRNAIGLCKI